MRAHTFKLVRDPRPSKKSACARADPVNYDSTARRLNTKGTYCAFTTAVNACITSLVEFDNVSRRLHWLKSLTSLWQYCPDNNNIEYDSSARRLKLSPIEPYPCIV